MIISSPDVHDPRVHVGGSRRRFSALFYAFGGSLFHESEHIASDAAHLDLFRTFSDPISTVMSVDVFEGLMT